jgi:nicotinate-nucleotide--dimethylbenzimidazole phosphoribosyltransferase
VAELLRRTIDAIVPPDAAVAAAVRRALDAKTKPRGSLGRLEELAARVAAARGTASPGRLRPAVVVAAADHGVAVQGVSAYPQEVTRQMLATFAAGGAAISVLAREAGARLVVIDAGVVEPLDDERIRHVRIRGGTADFTAGPAMSGDEAAAALEAGIALADELAAEGFTLVALGDMGIGNTTSAAALTAALLGADPEDVCGRGAGLDEAGLHHKISVVRLALERHQPDPADPLGVLAALGGLEIALIAGVALGAGAAEVPVVLDGFITTAAALVATRIAPELQGRLIASHRSPEPGHALALEALGLEPLLDLGLRLGEGSGAALALPLVQSALAVLADMATFEQAGVTDAGR